MLRKSLCGAVISAFLLFTPLFLLGQASSSQWNAPIHRLAAEILEKTGRPSSIALTVKNLSSLSSAQAQDVRSDLQRQLAEFGTSVTSAERAQASAALTLSEDERGYLWIAAVQQGPAQPVIIMVKARRLSGAAPELTQPLVLHKIQLWPQGGAELPKTGGADEDKLLDAALIAGANPAKLLLLTGSAVALYRSEQEGWVLEQSQPFASAQPWPRDLRGRLLVTPDHKFAAYLPGMKCAGEADPGIAMQCAASDDPWPLAGAASPVRAFFSRRNFFTGALSGAAAANHPPFFSAAVGAGSNPSIIFAGTDGWLRDQQGRQIAALAGSDVAGVTSGCGSGWQMLAAGNRDTTQADTIRAIDGSASGSQNSIAPMQLSGPVMALWTASEDTAATAIVRNLNDGSYEAFLLSVGCH